MVLSEKTKYGNRKYPPKALLLQWIKIAWASITPKIITKSFKKCGISNNLDNSDNEENSVTDGESN